MTPKSADAAVAAIRAVISGIAKLERAVDNLERRGCAETDRSLRGATQEQELLVLTGWHQSWR
jgi:hypothetical protein